MHGQRWVVIRYYDDIETEKFSVGTGLITDAGVVTLLQRLFSRDLTCGQILHGSMRKSVPAYMEVLEVDKESEPRKSMSIGANPRYVASLYEDHEGGIV